MRGADRNVAMHALAKLDSASSERNDEARHGRASAAMMPEA
jgi:hypothetical protein